MENVRIIDGKKFMWDGKTYETEPDVLNTKTEYEKNKFETRVVHQEEKYFLFTRRVVTEVVVEGQPPP